MRAWAGVVLAAIVLSGCGTAVAATGSGQQAGRLAREATGGQQAGRAAGGPVAGSRAEAAGLAKRLLARLPLPPGTMSAGKRPVPEGMRDLPGAPGGDSVILTRLLVAPGQPDVVAAYLQRHHPRGASVTTGSVSISGALIIDVTFDVPAPAGIAQAELGFQVERLTRTTSLVYADAFVIWYPPRSAAEHLSAASFRSVTVAVTQNMPPGQGKHASRTFTQRAVIAKLVAVIDGLHAAPYYAVPCPLFSTYSLRFNPVRRGGPSVTVASLSCVAASVTAGRADQPPLWDSPPALAPLAFQLLGLKP